MSRTAASSSDLRAQLRRLDDSIHGWLPDAERQMRRARLEVALNEALLAEAIAEADQRYDELERGLVAFDRRASRRVDWLRATGSVRETMVWDPSDTRMPDAPELSPSRRRTARRQARWTLTPVPAPRGI